MPLPLFPTPSHLSQELRWFEGQLSQSDMQRLQQSGNNTLPLPLEVGGITPFPKSLLQPTLPLCIPRPTPRSRPLPWAL